MGNVNCGPSDCMNMRPGQAASECFRQPSDSAGKSKLRGGTPQELLEEWGELLKQIVHAFNEDPESNFYVLRLSKPLLSQLFDDRTRIAAVQSASRQNQSPKKSLASNYGSTRRGHLLQKIMMSPASSVRTLQRTEKSPSARQSPSSNLVNHISLKELLSHMNAHTTYPSDFLPVTVQAEPLSLMEEALDSSTRGGSKSTQTLPQLKAKYEYELMYSQAVLYVGDTSVVRRFDFQMPERLGVSNFSVKKVQVSRGVPIDLKARQLLNQMREFFHLHNKLVIGGLQLLENEYELLFAQGCEDEVVPRQQNWPNLISGELIHSLSLLPGLMQRDEYKDTHFLQCIIRMQGYTYGGPKGSDFSKQVQFLAIFKESIFLPRKVDYLLSLQKDVVLRQSRINDAQVLNMIFNLAPNSFLHVLSNRKHRKGSRNYKAFVQKQAQMLLDQDKAYRRRKQANGNNSEPTTPIDTNQATDHHHDSNGAASAGLNFSSGSGPLNNAQNQSHTIDQLMFRSHAFAEQHDSGELEMIGQRASVPRVISMLAEDVASFAKVNPGDLVEELQLSKSPQKEEADLSGQQPTAMERLDALLRDESNREADQSVPVDESHILKYGKLQGPYLLESQSPSDGQPVVFKVDTSQKIGRIQEVGYVHYDSELYQTEQVVIHQTLEYESTKEILARHFDLEALKLRFIGVEGHWKVFYEEGSLTNYVYLSNKTMDVFNCIYEVQFYKSKLKGGLFGRELVFEGGQRKEPVTFAVQVNRPTIYLDDMIRIMQSDTLSKSINEFHSEEKLYYILHQVATLVKSELFEKGVVHGSLRLRSFHIDKLTWHIQMTSYPFAQRKEKVVKASSRGGLHGLHGDQDSLAALIEDLAQVQGNSSDFRIAMCHLSDLVQSHYHQGVQAVIEITQRQLTTKLQALIQTFTAEDKAEVAFDSLIKSIGLKPMVHSPFSWASMRSKNSLQDLAKSSLQSTPAVCQRIIYESGTSKAQILAFLGQIQDKITTAVRQEKESIQTQEETKEQVQPVPTIQMQFGELKPLQTEPQDKQNGDQIEVEAAKGLTLLYFYIEKQLKHASGSVFEAQETLLALQQLFNFDYVNLWYLLMRAMMTDFRLQAVVAQSDKPSNADCESKLDTAVVLIAQDSRIDLARPILEDLYLLQHPLADLYDAQDQLDLEQLNSPAIQRLIPPYFRQRMALVHLQNKRSQVADFAVKVLQPKLSGVTLTAARMEDYDRTYLLFYNMQRLVLMYIYHELVLPEESFPCADGIPDQAVVLDSQSRQASPVKVAPQNQRRLKLGSQSSSQSHKKRQQSPPPFHIQLHKFFRRLFIKSVEAQQSLQAIFVNFSETLLYLHLEDECGSGSVDQAELETEQSSLEKLWAIFCQLPEPKQAAEKTTEVADTPLPVSTEDGETHGTASTNHEDSKRAQSQASSSQKDQQSKSIGNLCALRSSKWHRMETVLQRMRKRIGSFDPQLVIDQHEKFFRQEYYKAAFMGQPVSRFDEKTEMMQPEDLGAEFSDYLAIVLQINDRSLDEAQLETFESSKTNFLRCPCCPPQDDSL